MLKAAAGGGGKGIRRVNNEEELTNAYEEARREALSAFGDSRMYLEKIMENVKHIEVRSSETNSVIPCISRNATVRFSETNKR